MMLKQANKCAVKPSAKAAFITPAGACSSFVRPASQRVAAAQPTQVVAAKARKTLVCNAVNLYEGHVMANPESKFAVVVARFNSLITKELVGGCLEGFHRHGVAEENIDVVWVPGSFELPVIAKNMAKSGQYDAVVCIGAVIRGATTHYDAVVNAATGGVLNAGVDSGVPTIFGVLTCDNLEQALDRAGGKIGNKGHEFAVSAIETANVLRDLKNAGKAA